MPHSINGRKSTFPELATLRALAELFPLTFVAAPYHSHRPVKCGVHNDLVAVGLVATAAEAHRVLGLYCRRRMYLLAVIEGATRVDLDGNPSGTVSAAEAAMARADLARLDAAADRRALEAKKAYLAARTSRNAVRERTPSAPPAPVPAPTPPPPPGPRLGIAGLRAAAIARRETTLSNQQTKEHTS
jgi:ProP effector